jgi:ABC-type lipoprotein export system ATPase subunit
MLIDVAIPHMNQCVREELDRVCPGTFTVSFDTLSETKSGNIRDKFSINIIHNIKCATGHKKLSGGEKRIIDFCCMSALRSLAEKLYGKMFGHIFYDEVLDSLDSESRELFCRSMKNQSNDHRNITMVTHALTEDVDPDRVFPF